LSSMLDPQVLAEILAFRSERDWERFHTPRNLAASIVIEAAELLEHFQWSSGLEAEAGISGERLEGIRAELADITVYLCYLARDLGIDIDAAVRDKMALNRLKYPVDKARGRSTKYDKL